MLYWVGGRLAQRISFVRALARPALGDVQSREAGQDSIIPDQEDSQPFRVPGLLRWKADLQGAPRRGILAGVGLREGTALPADGGQLNPGRPRWTKLGSGEPYPFG